MSLVSVTQLLRDDGSIVLFAGITEAGHEVSFGCDRRCARDLVEALDRGEDPEAEVETWQMYPTRLDAR